MKYNVISQSDMSCMSVDFELRSDDGSYIGMLYVSALRSYRMSSIARTIEATMYSQDWKYLDECVPPDEFDRFVQALVQRDCRAITEYLKLPENV